MNKKIFIVIGIILLMIGVLLKNSTNPSFNCVYFPSSKDFRYGRCDSIDTDPYIICDAEQVPFEYGVGEDLFNDSYSYDNFYCELDKLKWWKRLNIKREQGGLQ